MKKPQCGGGCLGAPMRALSRACDSACDLYVRGMSGCARHVPSGAAGAVGRGGYGISSASAASMNLRASSDRVDDLVRAAAKQSRRVAPEEAAAGGTKTTTAKGAALVVGSNKVQERKGGAAAAMETIAEDAPCEFGACALPPPSRRRGATASGLATRASGFGVVKSGREVFAL